jgi:hypothetical protein
VSCNNRCDPSVMSGKMSLKSKRDWLRICHQIINGLLNNVETLFKWIFNILFFKNIQLLNQLNNDTHNILLIKLFGLKIFHFKKFWYISWYIKNI